ncbi:signal peptidase I [Thalassiella azotivora]
MATSSDAVGTRASRRRRRRRTLLREVLALVLLGALLALVLRAFVVQAYVIPSGSMQPLLEPGDRVVVLNTGDVDPVDGTSGIRRGDVVVFDGTGLFAPTPDHALGGDVAASVARWLGLGSSERDFVKRVVGLPGERVRCCDEQGRITVDGVPLDEPYVFPGDTPSDLRFDVRVPDGRLWVMGDHRSDSADSRAHLGSPGGGMVPMSRVVGRVVAVVWPLDRWQRVDRGADTTAAATDPSGSAVTGDR